MHTSGVGLYLTSCQRPASYQYQASPQNIAQLYSSITRPSATNNEALISDAPSDNSLRSPSDPLQDQMLVRFQNMALFLTIGARSDLRGLLEILESQGALLRGLSAFDPIYRGCLLQIMITIADMS